MASQQFSMFRRGSAGHAAGSPPSTLSSNAAQPLTSTGGSGGGGTLATVYSSGAVPSVPSSSSMGGGASVALPPVSSITSGESGVPPASPRSPVRLKMDSQKVKTFIMLWVPIQAVSVKPVCENL